SSSLCPECKKVTQCICKICGLKTEEQFHNSCLYVESVQTRNGMRVDTIMLPQPALEKATNKNSINRSLRDALITFGIVIFFVLGFSTVAYLDLFENQNSAAKTIKSSMFTHSSSEYLNSAAAAFYENCLGHGNEGSITVTCPTEMGYVYKAVLAMPYDLAAKFSNSAFSIRGISLNENIDGSVTIEYQKNMYKTRFLEQTEAESNSR
ncbi:MAG: hypothetical protein ACREAG_02430, partial [Nitrosopumilaceae archaeon]